MAPVHGLAPGGYRALSVALLVGFVERTFAWMTRWRRLVRDYETRLDVSQAMAQVAIGGNLLRRISH
jgi:hypothetical protein